jgi:hypothetical protein
MDNTNEINETRGASFRAMCDEVSPQPVVSALGAARDRHQLFDLSASITLLPEVAGRAATQESLGP